MDCVNLAVVGCGSFGRYLASFARDIPRMRVVGVHDADPETARTLAGELDVAAYPTLDACLAAGGVDAVAICTPNASHAAQAIAAARAGRHVFCEKPMALDTAQCRAMIDAAAVAGTVLMVGHKRRLRPAYAAMAEVVASRRLGRLVAVDVSGFHDRPPRGWWSDRQSGGGLLPYSGVHDLDVLRVLAGEAETVYARTSSIRDGRTDFEDAIAVVIGFASGAVGSLQVTWRHTGVGFHDAFAYRIALEGGAIDYDPIASVVEVRPQDGAVERRSFDREAGFAVAYRRELESFAAAVLDGATPVVTGLDGLRCVELMEAAARSAERGTVIALPLAD